MVIQDSKTDAVVVVTALLLVLIIGCNKSEDGTLGSEGTMLPGTYWVAYSHGTEKLLLEENGSFMQEYVPKPAGTPIRNSGKWTFDPASGKIDLDDALIFDTGEDQQRSPPLKTRWSLRVAVTRSELRIVINRDLMLYYVRKQPK